MYTLEESIAEIKKLKGQIKRKLAKVAEAETALEIAHNKDASDSTLKTQADVVLANSLLVNLKAELYLLQDKQRMHEKNIAVLEQSSQPGNE